MLFTLVEYNNGFITGDFIEYDTINGNKTAEGLLYKGEPVGLWKAWYVSGKIKRTSLWENGKLNGEYKEWYEDGNLKEIGFFKDMFKNGLWISFNEKGDTLKKIFYNNGNILIEKDYK